MARTAAVTAGLGRIRAAWHERLVQADASRPARSLRDYFGIPRPCALTDLCGNRAEEGHAHCLAHILSLRESHERACYHPRCIAPARYWASTCTDHGEGETTPVVPAPHPHGKLVPGLTVARRERPDPDGSGRYPCATIPHRFEGRTRVYLTAYLDGLRAEIGWLAYWWHPVSQTVYIKRIDVDEDYWRQGVASAMQDVVRAERPGALIDQGGQSSAGKAWWAAYCAARGIEPGEAADALPDVTSPPANPASPRG